MSERHSPVLFGTLDPTNPVGLPGGTPAMTTLLYRVCDGDGEKFDEACRLICLLLDKKAELDGEPLKKLERLMGYVQNGTDGIVILFQDDVDMDYCVNHRVNHRAACSANPGWTVSDKTLMGAINKAYDQHKDDCE